MRVTPLVVLVLAACPGDEEVPEVPEAPDRPSQTCGQALPTPMPSLDDHLDQLELDALESRSCTVTESTCTGPDGETRTVFESVQLGTRTLELYSGEGKPLGRVAWEDERCVASAASADTSTTFDPTCEVSAQPRWVGCDGETICPDIGDPWVLAGTCTEMHGAAAAMHPNLGREINAGRREFAEDLDGDGEIELGVVVDSTLRIYHQDLDEEAWRLPVGLATAGIPLDVDRDGQLDLAWIDSTSGYLVAVLDPMSGNTSTTIVAPPLPASATSTRLAKIGELEGEPLLAAWEFGDPTAYLFTLDVSLGEPVHEVLLLGEGLLQSYSPIGVLQAPTGPRLLLSGTSDSNPIAATVALEDPTTPLWSTAGLATTPLGDLDADGFDDFAWQGNEGWYLVSGAALDAEPTVLPDRPQPLTLPDGRAAMASTGWLEVDRECWTQGPESLPLSLEDYGMGLWWEVEDLTNIGPPRILLIDPNANDFSPRQAIAFSAWGGGWRLWTHRGSRAWIEQLCLVE